MKHEDATETRHHTLRVVALAAVVATGIGATATAMARSLHHRQTTLEATPSVSQSGIGCDDYWAWAEMLTGVPREIQIGMTAIGYAAAGAPQPERCSASGATDHGRVVDQGRIVERSSAATDHGRTATVDVGALWQSLSTLPSPEADNAIAALAPETRAQVGHLAEVIAAAHGWH